MASTTPSRTNCRASSALSHCDKDRPITSGRSQANLTTYNATTGGKTGRRPGRFLSDKPSMPDTAKRSAHLRTCRSRNSTCLAVAAKEYPSANSNMARARLASPTGVFCFRSHPVKVARVWSSIPIWIAEWRPCISPLSKCRAGVMKHLPPHCQFFCPFSMETCTKRKLPAQYLTNFRAYTGNQVAYSYEDYTNPPYFLDDRYYRIDGHAGLLSVGHHPFPFSKINNTI